MPMSHDIVTWSDSNWHIKNSELSPRKCSKCTSLVPRRSDCLGMRLEVYQTLLPARERGLGTRLQLILLVHIILNFCPKFFQDIGIPVCVNYFCECAPLNIEKSSGYIMHIIKGY